MARRPTPRRSTAGGPTRPRTLATAPIDRETIFTLKVTCDRADDVYRTIEIAADQSFDTLHEAIREAFELDDDHLYAFFLTNVPWDRKDVVTRQVSFPGERASHRTLVGEVGLQVGREILYIFDFGDELRHGIEVVATGARQAGTEYPRIVESVGEAPPQYESDEDFDDEAMAPELDDDLEPLVEEIRRAIDEADAIEDALETQDGLESAPLAPPARPPVDAVERHADLARRLLEALQDRPAQIVFVAESVAGSVEDWLHAVACWLLDLDRNDEAVALSKRVSEQLIDQPLRTRAAFGRVLGRAHRDDEARAIADEILAACPDDVEAMDDAADILRLSGDFARSEALTRTILRAETAKTLDEDLRWGAQSRLVDLVRARGDGDEAARLEKGFDQEFDRLKAALAQRASRTYGTVVVAPKPGRNDPCSCGSGKKYKKCCGG